MRDLWTLNLLWKRKGELLANIILLKINKLRKLPILRDSKIYYKGFGQGQGRDVTCRNEVTSLSLPFIYSNTPHRTLVESLFIYFRLLR